MINSSTTYALYFLTVEDFNRNTDFVPANDAWSDFGYHDEDGNYNEYHSENNEFIVEFSKIDDAVKYASLIAKYFDVSITVTKHMAYTCEHGLSAELCYGPNHYALEA